MKKLLIFSLILSTLFFISCSEEEENDINNAGEKISGTLNFDGANYQISDGLYVIEADSGFMAGGFVLVDGEINAADSTFSGNFQAAVLTLSEGTTFQSGSYPVYSLFDEIPETVTKFAIVLVTTLEGETEDGGIGSGGSVNISRNGDVFEFSFNTDFLPSRKLTGTASGALQRADVPVE